jgi:hypothetical protein
MALGLLVAIWPRSNDEVIMSFGTGSLVTGIALLTTGFVQAQRHEIAYYQQSLIIWLAGMAFGPAAITWLRRSSHKTDYIFLWFTCLYAAFMGAFLFFTIGNVLGDGPVTHCFLDDVPSFYGRSMQKTINAIVVAVSIAVIVLSGITNKLYQKNHPGGEVSFFTRRPTLRIYWEWAVVVIVFAVETMLAVLVDKTIITYGQFVTDDQRAEANAWGFGQIISFMLLIGPLMDALKAILARGERKAAEKNAARGEVSQVDTNNYLGKGEGEAEARNSTYEKKAANDSGDDV